MNLWTKGGGNYWAKAQMYFKVGHPKLAEQQDLRRQEREGLQIDDFQLGFNWLGGGSAISWNGADWND